MVKQANIIAINETGKKAIEMHIESSKKLKFTQRMVVRQMGYVQTVTNEDPFTLEVQINNRQYQEMLKPDDFCRKIIEALKENGAENLKDYKIDIIE